MKSCRVAAQIAVVCAFAVVIQAQQAPVEQKATDRTIRLDVVVAPKSGSQVGGLQQSDFTVLDNNIARPITSFKPAAEVDGRTEVVLLMDAVNTRFQTVAYEQQQLQAFLRSNDGHLAAPTTIAVLTDKGVQIQPNFTLDGNALSQTLDHYSPGLRDIRNSAGFWGAEERLQVSLGAVNQFIAFGKGRPGRKVVVWISPGWPLLSGPHVDLDSRQQQQIFSDVVRYSTQLRQANITFYDVNPLGPGENLVREDYYQAYVKAVTKPQQTDLADIGLQVLSEQTGGLVLQGTSDIAGMLKKCFADEQNWYQISFDAARAEQPNEFHRIEIKMARPGLTARTRNGYYAQP